MPQPDSLQHDGAVAGREARVRSVINDCLRRRAAGEAITDDTVIAAHPELMPELDEELRRLRIIVGARDRAPEESSPFEAKASVADVDTRSHRVSDSGSGHLEVRCPSCHEPMNVAVDTQLTDLTCSACGSHFSLVDKSQATRMAPSLSKLGRFELIERLGVGGFGSVWKARDRQLDRTVAIKIPRAGCMTAEEQEKFFREARAAAQLRHPSIVSVHEVGRDGDSVYLVSDFVRGVTLGDWLTGQKVTGREAAELTAKIADALHHAHEQGVVHRDLKPANIMIDGDGEPHLMDFGLARREAGEITVTIDGQVLGTPAYMPPELAQGEAHTADRRSDVYSLGVILFQLLTGELPFRGNAHMLMHQVIYDDPPSPRKLNGNVPKDLETISLKCLEKDPLRRYQTSEDLSAELRRFLSDQPILARPMGQGERAFRWVRRNKIVTALAAAAVAALVTGTIVSSYFAIEARREAVAANVARGEAIQRAAELLNELLGAIPASDPSWNTPYKALCRGVVAQDELFRRLIQLRSDDIDLWVARGWLLAQRRDWKGAAAAYNQLPTRKLSGDARFEYACLQHLAGNEAELHRFLKECEAVTHDNADGFLAFVHARAAGIAPQAAVSPDRTLAWALKALETRNTSWYLNTLALAHYRNGEFDHAMDYATISNKRGWAPPLAGVQNWLIMAMAAHRLGRTADAQQYLAEARKMFAQFPTAERYDISILPVTDLLGAEVLRREAEALIGKVEQ